jgi:hypothetical protein
MTKKRTDDESRTTLDLLIEQLQSPDLEGCAVIAVTKGGSMMIGSHNIEEVDVIELLQKGANYMIDEGCLTLGQTIH